MVAAWKTGIHTERIAIPAPAALSRKAHNFCCCLPTSKAPPTRLDDTLMGKTFAPVLPDRIRTGLSCSPLLPSLRPTGHGSSPVQAVSLTSERPWTVGICRQRSAHSRTLNNRRCVGGGPLWSSLVHAGRLRLRLKLSSRCCRPTSMGHG